MANILVIDDEHNIQMSIRLALKHVGHTVELASDGSEGLTKFGSGEGWDLVLLDQRMQGLSGLEVLRKMRSRDPDSRIIMITAFGTIDLAVDAMKAGATDFLRKPFTSDVLRGAVKAALQGSPADRVSGIPQGESVVYGLTTLNGFRVESRPGPGDRVAGDITHTFTVKNPEGEARQCRVRLPVYVVELVKARADRESMPGGNRFWQGLCEEVLANYLWQHADFPADDALVVDELTAGLQRWVDAVVGANA